MKEDVKKALSRYAKKDNLLIIALLGILLMVIAVPTGGNKTTNENEKAAARNVLTGNEVSEFERPYEETMEKELEELLESMEGVGKVHVMLTLSIADEKNPGVEGVVVVAQGADDVQTIIEITEVIQSLFDIPIHKIRVVRMKL